MTIYQHCCDCGETIQKFDRNELAQAITEHECQERGGRRPEGELAARTCEVKMMPSGPTNQPPSSLKCSGCGEESPGLLCDECEQERRLDGVNFPYEK